MFVLYRAFPPLLVPALEIGVYSPNAIPLPLTEGDITLVGFMGDDRAPRDGRVLLSHSITPVSGMLDFTRMGSPWRELSIILPKVARIYFYFILFVLSSLSYDYTCLYTKP